MNRLSTHWFASCALETYVKRILHKKIFPIKKQITNVLFGCLLYMMQKLISDISHWKNYYGPKNRIYNWLISFYVSLDNELLHFGYIFCFGEWSSLKMTSSPLMVLINVYSIEIKLQWLNHQIYCMSKWKKELVS